MLKTLVLTTGCLVPKEFAHNAKTLLLISQVIWGLINKLRILKKLVLISQVVWCERNLLTMFKNHLAAGYGNEGSWAYLSSRLLCLSSLPLSLLCWGQILSTLECCSLRRSLLWRQRIPLPKAIIHMTQQRTKSCCTKSDSANSLHRLLIVSISKRVNTYIPCMKTRSTYHWLARVETPFKTETNRNGFCSLKFWMRGCYHAWPSL